MRREWGDGGRDAVIKYLGSKRALIPWILAALEVLRAVAPVRRVGDLFAGTARVGHACKAAGYEVIANDLLTFSYVLCDALVAADARAYPPERLQPLLAELGRVRPRDGWFVQAYARDARFFHPSNAARIQAMREAVDRVAAGDPTLRSILLTSLLLAADRVDSTAGVQMAYLKQWAPRALRALRLEPPPLLPGRGAAMQGDAIDAAAALDVDVVYVDPPYNQHSYLGNYHVWETLVLWDRPPTYGTARKRIDCQTRKSAFNLKGRAGPALDRLLAAVRADHVLLSFSDEGFFTPADIEARLAADRFVVRLEREYRRYVGAVIGIYNPHGRKVGRVSHTRNREYLFVATRSRAAFHALRHATAVSAAPAG